MKTNNTANKTKLRLNEPVEDIIDIPRPIVALANDFPDGHHIPYHMHSRTQLLYASSGVMSIQTEEGIWVVPPMRGLWLPSFTEHQISVSGHLSMRTLYIKPDVISNLPSKCSVVSIPPLLRELILYAVTLPRLYPLNSPEERVMTVILDQIQSLSVTPLDLPIPKDTRLNKIFQALSVNPSDNRTLEEWGRTVGSTSRTLSRLFRSDTGMSFRQWRQQIRILEALKYLGRNEPVTTIALELGYDSPSAFISMFKKALGKTPGQYFLG
jgi:AraC-like DNA-binding protein